MFSDKGKPPAAWKKAASTSIIPPISKNCNKKENEEENASSAAAKKIISKENSAAASMPTSTTTIATTVRSHSPRKMQTQIAKLVYNPSTNSNSNRNDVNEMEKTANATIVAVATAEVDDFEKKRQDRDREVKEIHEMLNEITKTPTKKKKDVENDDDNKPSKVKSAAKDSPSKKPITTKPTIQRSKTDTNLRRPTARKTLAKDEVQTARCKSAHHLNEEKNSPPKPRQKAYNSEEAQRYMQEQKKKRRSLQMNVQNDKEKLDREEIKKRLENLRQSTRKIVDKNVKIAKKKADMTEEKPFNLKNRLNKEPKITRAWPERPLKPPTSPRRSDEVRNEVPEVVKTSRTEAWAETLSAKTSPEKRQNSITPLAENHKKIGLLRKPEFKDHSFSAIKDINMDKENLIIDNLTPQVSGYPTSRLQDRTDHLTPNYPTNLRDEIKEHSTTSSLKSLEHNQPDSAYSLSGKSLKRRSTPPLELKIPEAKLRSRRSVREKSVQADTTVLDSSKQHQQQKTSDLPYWLKPTSVQAYPYNFIMAVRKKLEAIANPPIVASSSSQSLDQVQKTKKPVTETPVSSYSKTQNRTNNVKRRIINQEDQGLVKSLEKSSSNKENIGGQSYSEFTSNFSSISIQLPKSDNTVSSFSQKPKLSQPPQPRFDEDDTTISSSVFSSPEKKKKITNEVSKHISTQAEAISPLATENISNLQIKAKSMRSNITLERGHDYESSQRRFESGSITNRSIDGSVNFSQLLDDFNRSLSQVIEVNQQLKTTLVKSQIFSPEKKSLLLTTNPVELPEYLSDFEESSNAEVNKSKSSQPPYRTESESSIHSVAQERSSASMKQSSDNIQTLKSSSSPPSSSSNEEIQEEASQTSSRNQLQSQNSFGTQTFIVTPEEKPNSTRTQTIHEEILDESPNKENMSANQYSLDSLETSQRDDYVVSKENYIQSHINTSRGNYEPIEPPPGYKISSESQACSSSNLINSSMDSEFVRIFNKSDMEISVLSLNNRSLSESTVNYSSIGMYEKLIQNETNKSEHLAAMLKMREKALIDRTKGQIAWLEVQKKRYKTKGLVLQISAVKKKQRAILLKMEKERDEIKKLLKRTKVQREDNNRLRIPETRPLADVTPLLQQRRTIGVQLSSASSTQKHHQQQQHQHQTNNTGRSKTSSSAIVRGYELETSRSLEQLLQKREEDLRRRREHVERLMEWHRRLDQEEAEVLQLEKILFDYNNLHSQEVATQQSIENVAIISERNPNASQVKMEKKLKDIDRSLRELSCISGADGGSSNTTTTNSNAAGDFVRTSGSKLNKLWRRLTSQRIEKFQSNKKYKLCKADLEQLYEEAKLAVLHEFGENANQMEVFLGQTSIISTTPQPSNVSMEIPQLNLNFSSGQQSEEEEMRGNYSPSAAEEGFVVAAASIASTSSRDRFSDESTSKKHDNLPEDYNSSSSSHKRLEIVANSGQTKCGSKIPILSSRSGSCSDTELHPKDKKEPITQNDKSTFSSPIETAEGSKSLEEEVLIESHQVNSKTDKDSTSSESRTKTLDNQTKTIPELPSKSTESLQTPLLESQTEVSPAIVPEVNSLITSNTISSYIQSASDAKLLSQEVVSTESQLKTFEQSVPTEDTSNLKSSKNVPNSEDTLESQSVSSAICPTDSVKANSSSIKSQTLNISSNTKSSSESTLISNFGIKKNSKQTKNSISTEKQSEEMKSTNGLESKTSAEEVSILKSLLNSNSIFRTNGHDFLTNWTNSQHLQKKIEDEPSIITQVSDESTLKSIKSIDNSTNSKHSANQQDHIDEVKTNSNSKQESCSSVFEDSQSSNQVRSSVIMSTKSPPSAIQQSADYSEPLTNVFYESDFTEGDESNIDDVSMPKLETTGEEDEENQSQFGVNSRELEKRLLDLDASLKDRSDTTFDKSLSPEKTPSPPRDDDSGDKRNHQQQQQNNENGALMPDIISEVELRRRHQAMLENELKQLEHAVPYMYVREIPNKPPPPYVPPAHGSPMTTIFPSEERIKDITFRRTKELYYEILELEPEEENEKKSPSVLDENITNIYERIILDICKEYLTEYKPILTSVDPNNFHSSLAFFNPPDRLRCMQDFIYKEVRKNLAMDKNTQEKSQLYSVYGHRGKRDHIGEIIIQEMFDEDNIWSNFYTEEEEVLELVIEEMIAAELRDICYRELEIEIPSNSILIENGGKENIIDDSVDEIHCSNST